MYRSSSNRFPVVGAPADAGAEKGAEPLSEKLLEKPNATPSTASTSIPLLQGPYAAQTHAGVFGGTAAERFGTYYDPEANETRALYPGILSGEQMLRMSFIKKVYGIVAAQLTLTTIVTVLMMTSEAMRKFAREAVVLQFGMMLGSFILLIPLYIYRNSHPRNMYILGTFTFTMSWAVGIICTAYNSGVVLEALALTATVSLGLTAYTFWATRRGKEFDFMGPFLFSSLLALVVWGFFALLFPMGDTARQIYALLGAVLFSGYIVFDTFLLIKRYTVDEYIWAAVQLYLDLINLFVRILQLLGDRRD